jgi:membrane-bound metal-dependent hydrolase YbcI (DUF457 family)
MAAGTACFATWPDWDQKGSCAARSLGFISEAIAALVARLCGGHRHLSHTIWGIALFTLAAWGACHYRHGYGRWVLAFFLLLAIAAGLRAFRIHSHLADLAALAAAIGIAVTGWELVLVPLACGLGCATHIAGDMLTDSGCMLVWPLSSRRLHFWPEPFAFTTGTRPESAVAFVLVLMLGALAFHLTHIPIP